METNFKRERFEAHLSMPDACLVDLELDTRITTDEFLNKTIHKHLVGTIYSNTIDERDIEYYCPIPTFFDWLFRRSKKVVFKFKAKDLLLNPPSAKTLRTYELKREVKWGM